MNLRFYGREVSPEQLLTGQIPPPTAAQPLYEALALATTTAPSTLPPVFPQVKINVTANDASRVHMENPSAHNVPISPDLAVHH